MSNYSVSLKGIGIENFKAFGEYQHFDLAPITIITGPNNSGKSAIINALELIATNDIFSHLDFHSKHLEIGDISQVINKKSKLKLIEFTLNFNLSIHPQSVDTLTRWYKNDSYDQFKENAGEDKKSGYKSLIDVETFDITLGYDNSSGKLDSILLSFNNELILIISIARNICHIDYPFFEKIQNFNGKIFKESEYEKVPQITEIESLIRERLGSAVCIGDRQFQVNYLSNDSSLQKIEHLISYITKPYGMDIYYDSNNEDNSQVHYEFGDIYERYEFLIKYGAPKHNEQFLRFLNDIKENIIEIFSIAKEEVKKVFKLEAQRATKNRIYLYQEKDTPLSRDLIMAGNSERDEISPSNSKFKEFMNLWCGNKRFNLFEDFKFENIPGIGYRFIVLKNGELRELADLGFGTRQILPVILAVYNKINEKYYSHNILIIEEPESNLHPKLQSLLADLFVESTKPYNGPLIIETHSEYLIRKLQYLVAKQEVSPERIAIHYIGEETGKGRDIFKINIDKNGALDRSFGTGFFDVADNIALELFILSKHQKN